MNKCILTMMEEHELIVQVLASLQAMAEKLVAGTQVPRQDIGDFARFFREFADRCHHGKEEDRLFSKMVEAGFPRDAAPIGVMLAEHDAGREEVHTLGAIGAGSGAFTPAEMATAADSVFRFVPLLYAHIQKENNILYPMAQRAISPEEMQRLDESCDAFDREILGQSEVSGLKSLAAQLIRRYPADTTSLAVYAGCGGRACAAA